MIELKSNLILWHSKNKSPFRKGSITWNKINPMELLKEETEAMQPALDNVLKTTRETIEKT